MPSLWSQQPHGQHGAHGSQPQQHLPGAQLPGAQLPGAQLPGAQLPDFGLGSSECASNMGLPSTGSGSLGLSADSMAIGQQANLGGFGGAQQALHHSHQQHPHSQSQHQQHQQQSHHQQQHHHHQQQQQSHHQQQQNMAAMANNQGHFPAHSRQNIQHQHQQQHQQHHHQQRHSGNIHGGNIHGGGGSGRSSGMRYNANAGGYRGGGGGGMGNSSMGNASASQRGFNTNAPSFTPGGAGGVSGGAGSNMGGGGVCGVPAGSHYVPTQHQQFVAGAALAGLRKTGQSARHDAFFMPETLRAELAANRDACLYQGDPNDPRLLELQGVQIRQYHSLLPLDDPQKGKRSRTFGVPTSLFRVTSEMDGEAYTLRRLEGPPLSPEILSRSRMWSQMAHPNIVRLYEVFSSQEEGQPLSYVVQAFHPNALTLEQAFLHQRMPLNEETLWSIALQIIGAVHATHLAGMAVRALDVAHVLLTGKDTVRLSGAAVLDLTLPDAQRNVHLLQAEDLLSIARVLVNLACTSPSAASQHALQKSMGYIQATFSPEFSQLLMLLLSPQSTIHDIVAMTSGRMMTRLSQAQAYADGLQAELAKECENGRLLRLLAKLTHTAERPSLGMDHQWGEHSDRHLLRLFRDAVFHQTDEQGGAVLDFAQTVHALNRLDLGHESKVLLSSPGRHDGTLLLVSYRDVREVLERSFDELASSAQELPEG